MNKMDLANIRNSLLKKFKEDKNDPYFEIYYADGVLDMYNAIMKEVDDGGQRKSITRASKDNS